MGTLCADFYTQVSVLYLYTDVKPARLVLNVFATDTNSAEILYLQRAIFFLLTNKYLFLLYLVYMFTGHQFIGHQLISVCWQYLRGLWF